ncbi:Aste57867_17414 [Aphanomyces stellatus]|uniref:Aste57867_17414 protein n=1 Tax=Aphanomyces stellatus TaxID=120398 RepID=A0A485L8L2_9STRA|nr:hypothetical protein As57867_017354 [Aphanomyces stellatus]VFT94170.1 Aste57867_17414 [Aphanomyces stellatus]
MPPPARAPAPWDAPREPREKSPLLPEPTTPMTRLPSYMQPATFTSSLARPVRQNTLPPPVAAPTLAGQTAIDVDYNDTPAVSLGSFRVDGDEGPYDADAPAPPPHRTWLNAVVQPLTDWLLGQWHDTVAFESYALKKDTKKTPVEYKWVGVPLLLVAILVGVTVCVVVDGLVYGKGDDDDDDDRPLRRKKREWVPSPFSVRNVTHQYTWFHVILVVVLFDAAYALLIWNERKERKKKDKEAKKSAAANALADKPTKPTKAWHIKVHVPLTAAKAVSVLTTQVLFFLKMFGAVESLTWVHVASPLALWTLLLAMRLQWQTLLGLTALLVSVKANDFEALTYAQALSPLWLLLLLMLPLFWLLPGSYGNDGYILRFFWLPQAFSYFFVAVPLAIYLHYATGEGIAAPKMVTKIVTTTTAAPLGVLDPSDEAKDDEKHTVYYWWFILVWALPLVFLFFHLFLTCQYKRYDRLRAQQDEREARRNAMATSATDRSSS